MTGESIFVAVVVAVYFGILVATLVSGVLRERRCRTAQDREADGG